MPAYGDMNPALSGLIKSQYIKIDTGVAQEAMTAGLPVFSYPGSDNKIWKLKADVSRLVFSVDLSASNSTVTTVNGVNTAGIVFATSHLNTMNLIVNAIKGLAGVEAVLDNTDATNRTILIRTKGVTSTASAVVSGGTAVTVTPTNGLNGQVFRGVTALQHLVPSTTGGSGTFVQYDAVPVARGGEIWADAVVGLLANARALVNTTTGTFGPTGIDVGVRCDIARNSDGIAAVTIDDSGIFPTTFADRF